MEIRKINIIFIALLLFIIPNVTFAAFTIAKPPYMYKLVSSLTGHWTFDGKDVPNGRANDISGNGNHGSLTNIATSTFYAMGKLGQAFNFDGVNDEVLTNISLSNFITASEGTIAVWIKPKATTETGGNAWDLPNIVADDLGIEGSYISIAQGSIGGNDRIWAANVRASDGTEQRVGVTYTPDEWVHITWVHSGGNLYIYKNGVLGGSVPSTDTHSTGMGNYLRFGRNYNQSDTYNGVLDDVRTYNRALTDSEITQLYNFGATKLAVTPKYAMTSGLVGHWTFDGKDMPNGVARDISGNENHGSLKNIATSTFYTAGRIGQGLSFDGADDYINVPAHSSIANIWDGGGTVSFWIRPSSAGEAENGLFLTKSAYWGFQASSGHDVGETGFQFSVDFTNTPLWRTNTSGIVFDSWNHVVLTYNSDSTSNDPVLYVNGSVVSLSEITTPTGTRASESSQSLQIGSNEVVSRANHGRMDDVRIYDRILTMGDISQLYNIGR